MEREIQISVVIPVYNTEKYLPQCLDSIINQTLRNIEIICVDDGSTDRSPNILRDYAERDKRIIILTQEKSNAGVARNKGLEIARGEYLSFLDSDDFFHPQMLEKAYKKAKDSKADIVVFRAQRYWERTNVYEPVNWTIKKNVLPAKTEFSSDEAAFGIFDGILGYAWDKLFNRAFVEEKMLFFQSQPIFNDAFFTYGALIQAHKIALLDDELIYQRKREIKGSITDRRSLFYDCGYHLLEALKELMLAKGIYEKFERAFINYAIHLLSVDLRSKKAEIRKQMLRELKNSWIQELEIYGHAEEFYYDKEEYNQLLRAIYPVIEMPHIQAYLKQTQTIIPVVYATDDNYFKYVICSIVSILQYGFDGIFYRFIVLQHQNSDPQNQKMLRDIVSRHANCSVEFFEVGNQFENAHLCIEHITVATYYRLLLPELLPDCDKCIYLDGDTIVADDLLGLYSIPMGNNHLAGVKAYVYYETALEHKERLQIPQNTEFEYINAGVLLMNLKQMRQDNCVEKYMSLINEKFDSQDQDILNIASAGKIITLPFRYNVMTKYCRWDSKRLQEQNIEDEVKQGKSYPIIIHYADRIKPWENMRSMLAEYWWETTLSVSCWSIFANEKSELILSTVYGKNKTITSLENTIKQLKSSRSYRLGRFLTFVPRKIIGGVKCCKEHGIHYTAWRAWQKLKSFHFK